MIIAASVVGVGLDGGHGLGRPSPARRTRGPQHREAQRVEDGRCRNRRRPPTGRPPCPRGRRRRGPGTGSARGSPRLTQYWKAILSACSTATAPSEAKTTWASSTGTTAASASANSMTTRLPLPSSVAWATLPELVDHGGVELGHPVAERGHPQRRDGVEVPVPVDVDELAALGPLHGDRGVARVGGHLGEPVPHHGDVPGDPRVGGGTTGVSALIGRESCPPDRDRANRPRTPARASRRGARSPGAR